MDGANNGFVSGMIVCCQSILSTNRMAMKERW